jgi:hypothetical protein
VWLMAKAKNVRDADVVQAPATGANTSSAFNISWQTLGLCDSWVDYGPTTAYAWTVGTSARSTAHNVTAAIPSAGVYHYRVRSVSRDGDSYTSPDMVVGTPSPALVTVPDDYNTIGPRAVVFRWSDPNPPAGPFSYTIRVRDASTGTLLWTSSVVGTSTITGVFDAGYFSWDVSAIDQAGVAYGTSLPSSFSFWHPVRRSTPGTARSTSSRPT